MRYPLALALLTLAACGTSGSSSHDPIMAFIVCEDFVRDRLVSPSTADFPKYTKEAVDTLGENRYLVTSYVDAQNAMGGTPRTAYVCSVRYEPGSKQWLLEGLVI